ncbi:MAG: alginate O-acetyltransferase complex protein AlgJ [Verrucomicrobiota bacterium]|jgi:alginate O-acetyltransferase complex protein AlgJ
MTKPDEPNIPVGHAEPLKPAHSLPRYSEPTPETHRKVSREQEAELALKNSAFAGSSRILLIGLFLLTILSVPAIQFAYEMRTGGTEPRAGTFNVYKAYPAWEKIRAVRGPRDLWRLLPRGAELKAAEKELETESVVSEWLLPRVQLALLNLGAGNEQVYLGRDHWLFYRPDVDYVTGPPFLEPKIMTHRAHTAGVQSDPVKAIIAFRDQLASRGIDLIAVPIPMKPGVEPRHLSARARKNRVLQNPSFAEFKARLEKSGVRVFDPATVLPPGDAPLFLEADTHWRPETMELVAEKLAEVVGGAPSSVAIAQISNRPISAVGDIARMLKVPEARSPFRAETVTVHEVTPPAISKDAEILLLGDSFSNIFSLGALGWGESAGFAEHLSRALRRPIDCILRNSDAAFATREMLSRELARGRDRLAGQKLVIWEFAARELAFGDWKMLEMKLGQPVPAKFFVPKPGQSVTATGTIEAISAAPRPGSVPYKDHILALHLTDLMVDGREESAGLEAFVYAESMRDNALTAIARLRAGDRVTFRLRPWSDVSEQYEKINRSEIDDPAVQLEEPCWGELK